MAQRVAVIGVGTMGEAILKGLVSSGHPPERLAGTVRRAKRLPELQARHPGVSLSDDNVSACASADLVVLAVKPQSARKVIEAVGPALDDTLLVSICAGVTLAQLDAWAPRARLVRAMPNTPSLIGEGMTVLSPGPRSTDADLEAANAVFASVSRVRELEEKHLDAVTALSGSGPAFACVVLEALADGGVMMGLPRDVAVELAAQTMQGAARLVLQTGAHPAALKDDVTTPAGCTIAGILTMEDGRIRSTLARTIQEATRVASGLGQD